MNEMTNDRNVMENLLLLEKSACDLYMHGAIEASDEQVFNSFSSALNQSLQLQNQIYTKELHWHYPIGIRHPSCDDNKTTDFGHF